MNEKELSKYLKQYLDKGFYLFPLTKNRTPFKEAETVSKYASNSLRQVNKWIKERPGCNWGVWLAKSDYVAVDIDMDHGGMDRWAGYVFEEGEPHTMKQVSARGGNHYIFKAGGRKFRKNFDGKRGIDVKHNGYIAVVPSINEKNGKGYTWEKGFDVEIAEIPEWLIPYIVKQVHDLPDQAPLGVTSKEFVYFESLCERIAQKEFAHDEWVGMGMAIHHEFPGPEGFHLWDIISRGINYNAEKDDELIRSKWESFKDDKEQNRTIKSLLWDAQNTFNIKLSIGIQEWMKKIEYNENAGWFNEEDRLITVRKDAVISWMNDNGYFMLTEGQAMGLTHVTDITEEGQKRADLIKAENLSGLLANRAFKYYVRNAKGDLVAKYKDVYDVWAESVERKEYSGIVFEPNGAKGTELNLWEPIVYDSIPGDVSDFHTLCDDAISSGDLRKSHWLKQWLAHIIQNPGQKCTFGPVLIGLQGTGKGTLIEDIMGGILKHYFWKVDRADGLTSKFNVHLAKRLLTFMDESTWRGHKAEDNFMKNRMSSKNISLEEKFGAAYKVSDFTRHCFASNNAEAVGIEKSNRRYVVFHTNDKYAKKGNKDLFRRINQGIQEGSLLPAVFHYLATMDLSEFDYTVFPDFDSQSETTVLKTEGIIPTFWNEILFHSPKRVFRIRSDKTECLDKKEVFKEFEFYAREKGSSYDRAIARQAFWEKTNTFLPKLRTTTSRMRLDESNIRVCSISLVDLANHYNEEMGTDHELMNPHEFFLEDEHDFEEIATEGDF